MRRAVFSDEGQLTNGSEHSQERRRDHIQSLDRAADILEYLAFSKDSRGLLEISKDLGLHKSTVHRILGTLMHRNYVQQEAGTARYRIGLRLLELGDAVLQNLDLRPLHRFLQELMQHSQETVHLGVLEDGEVVYVDKVESKETIRMYSRLGHRVPAHCTSLGKMLLAYSPESAVERILAQRGLPRFTEHTITDEQTLWQHLAEIRRQGYAIDNEEHEKNIRCISGPIFDYKGGIAAAFSISGPKFRMTQERLLELEPLVRDYSQTMSQALGAPGR